MILSYHPCFTGDQNRLCAGREPDDSDLRAIARADGVVLPQGGPARLYEMAAANCAHVFPNYGSRYRYPGKIGQIRLFREIGAPHPETRVYDTLAAYYRETAGGRLPAGFQYPLIFKFDWGGEGDTVWLLRGPGNLAAALDAAASCEKTGQKGFLLQSFVPSGNRCLRAVIIGQQIITYWKVQSGREKVGIGAGVSKGARIDPHADPELQQLGIKQVNRLCARTGINLAAFDLLLPETASRPTSLFLEINYFFGRKGLGGSEAFYEILIREIRSWIHRRGLGQPVFSKKKRQT